MIRQKGKIAPDDGLTLFFGVRLVKRKDLGQLGAIEPTAERGEGRPVVIDEWVHTEPKSSYLLMASEPFLRRYV